VVVTRHLLVVLLNDAVLSELRSAVEERGGGSPNVYVVAPSHVGPLRWLATDEQAARAEAGARALEAEWILGGEAAVGGEAGEADPILAVEDALRRFPADEILLVGGGANDRSLQTSLRGLGVPITWVGRSLPARGNRSRLREAARGLASGRSSATPFVAFAGANLALLLIGLLITLVVAVVIWLSGLT
jgi:hypothetical protein